MWGQPREGSTPFTRTNAQENGPGNPGAVLRCGTSGSGRLASGRTSARGSRPDPVLARLVFGAPCAPRGKAQGPGAPDAGDAGALLGGASKSQRRSLKICYLTSTERVGDWHGRNPSMSLPS